MERRTLLPAELALTTPRERTPEGYDQEHGNDFDQRRIAEQKEEVGTPESGPTLGFLLDGGLESELLAQLSRLSTQDEEKETGRAPEDPVCEPWEVFQVRAPNWNASGAYGNATSSEEELANQRRYGEACLSVVAETVHSVRDGLSPEEALDPVATGRGNIARDLKHNDSSKFGKRRGYARNGAEPTTPITGRYRPYGMKTLERWGQSREEEDEGSRMKSTNDDGFRNVETFGKIRDEEVPLTQTTFTPGFDGEEGIDFERRLAAFEADEKRWKAEGGKKEERPRDTSGQPLAGWGHTKAGKPNNSPMKKAEAHAMKLYAEAMRGDMPLEELQDKVAEVHWWLAHAMPFERGGAAIADMLTKTIWMHKGVRVYRWKEGVVPDLEAFIRPIRDFVAAYPGLMEAPPREDPTFWG